MLTAVFSDIHANLEALEAVCGAAEDRAVHGWICLGDVVGYGADPAACLKSVRSLTKQILRGNHDAAVAGLEDLEYFNEYAREAVLWTREHLGARDRRYLGELPFTFERDQSFYVHAEPADPSAWEYIDSSTDVAPAMEAIDSRLCFVGHSHQALAFATDGSRVESVAEGVGRLELREGYRYLVNVGSVGQPRDGDPRSCFAIYDDEAGSIELVRIDYDIARAQEKILRAGLPPFLAARLQRGH
jgi:diadenosine tetraphosphatase ApaH/serine/threonine PP2A family protein phosphatase